MAGKYLYLCLQWSKSEREFCPKLNQNSFLIICLSSFSLKKTGVNMFGLSLNSQRKCEDIA